MRDLDPSLLPFFKGRRKEGTRFDLDALLRLREEVEAWWIESWSGNVRIGR